MLKKIALATSAIALAATPIAAQQANAEIQREAAPVSQESKLSGNNTTLYFILGIATVVGAIVLLSENDDDEAISS